MNGEKFTVAFSVLSFFDVLFRFSLIYELILSAISLSESSSAFQRSFGGFHRNPSHARHRFYTENLRRKFPFLPLRTDVDDLVSPDLIRSA